MSGAMAIAFYKGLELCTTWLLGWGADAAVRRGQDDATGGSRVGRWRVFRGTAGRRDARGGAPLQEGRRASPAGALDARVARRLPGIQRGIRLHADVRQSAGI